MPARKRHRQPKPDAPESSLSATWQINGHADIRALLDAVFDPARYHPLLLVSCATDTQRPRVDLDSLSRAIDDDITIATLADPDTAWHFTNATDNRFPTYGGAVRLFWPYATPQDPAEQHPVFVTMAEEHSSRTVHSIARTLSRNGREHGTTQNQPTPDQPAQDEQNRSADADLLTARLAAANDRVTQLRTENNTMRRQIRGLTDQIADLERRLYHQDIFADPEQQLRHEIEHTWLITYAEPDRAIYPLRGFTLGADFLASMDRLHGIERERIVEACVDVLTRRAYEINSRRVHPLRTSAVGGAPQRIRDDGSGAWRCNLQTGTPSARRLMWWELTDGTAELAKVAIHDDFDLA